MYTVETKPIIPTILAGQRTVRLPGYDLWMTYIENVHVVPTRICSQRFTGALASTLTYYPHAAGKLFHHNGQWEIALTDSPIGVEVEESEVNSFEGSADDDLWTVQTDIRRHLWSRSNWPARYPSYPSSTDLSSVDAFSLLFFKLTMTSTDTVIGVTWHHTLGDAMVLLRFMQTLSRMYQGESVDVPPNPLPTFTKVEYPPANSSLIESYASLMPHLARACSMAELGDRYAVMNRDTSRVAFRVSACKLRELRDTAFPMEDNAPQFRPTLQDCLTAFIVTVMNRYLPDAVNRVTNAASYRRVSGAVESPDVAGNAIFILPCTLDPANSDFKYIATSLRRTITASRDVAFIKDYMTVADHLMSTAVGEGRYMFFGAPPGQVSVNSNLAIDWHTVDFGFSSGGRFHTSGINDRYIRVFWSNTVGEESTSDAVSSRTREIEVLFAVESKYRDDIASMIMSMLKDHTFPHNIL